LGQDLGYLGYYIPAGSAPHLIHIISDIYQTRDHIWVDGEKKRKIDLLFLKEAKDNPPQTIRMTDLFIYRKGIFENIVLSFFKKNYTATEIKDIINANIRTGGSAFKNAVYRRIINYRVGKDNWWLSMEEIRNSTKITRELVAIWKLVINIKRGIYSDISVEDFGHNKFEALEKQLVDGEINEQTYIEECNFIKLIKEVDEQLMDCCSCCPIGSMNPHEGGEPVLRIMCLPCDWDRDSTCVRFI